ICCGVGLEQLDEISRWVFQQDLLAARALHDRVAEMRAPGPEPIDARIEIVDAEVNAVPAAGGLLLARGHWGAATGAASLRLRQIKMHVAVRNLGEARRGMHLHLEAEMRGVERDGGSHVVDDIAEACGHGSILSLLGLARSARTYLSHGATSTYQNVGPID